LFNHSKTTALKNNFIQALPFWVASVISGFVAVAFTMLFNIVENAFNAISAWHPSSILIITPLSFCAAYLIVYFFSPPAKGSGIPQVIAAIELNNKKHGYIIDELLNLKVILTKIFSCLLMVQGGAAIGREGPTIQISASIFRLVEKVVPSSWPKLSSQNFILTGAAAGLAAAFNTPLGGIVFGIEELAKIHVKYFRTALFTAVILAGLTAQGILGPYLYLGYPNVTTQGVIIFFAVGLVAVLSGLSAGCLCSVIWWIRRKKRNLHLTQNIVLVLVAGLAFGAIGFYINDNIFGSGKNVINTLLFTDNKDVGVDTVLIRILGPLICFNTGAGGGIFAPALAAGASLGGAIGHFLHYAGTDANILILCGMVGFLTGVTRTPFTSAILVLEMTDRHGVIFFLMFAAMMAYLSALAIDKHSLYDYLKKEWLPGSDRNAHLAAHQGIKHH
jgi:H+/Cl- antiporter ClcA